MELLLLLAMTQLPVEFVAGAERRIELSKECERYCNSNRPELSNDAYVLSCNKTKNPTVCQTICEHECPSDSVCAREDDYDYDEHHKLSRFSIRCPAGRSLPSLSALLISLILAGSVVSILILLGALSLGYTAYAWIERSRQQRQQALSEDQYNDALQEVQEERQKEKDNMSQNAPEGDQSAKKTPPDDQDVQRRQGYCGDSCITAIRDLKRTPSSISSL